MDIIKFLLNNNFEKEIIDVILNAKQYFKTKKLSWREARQLNIDMSLVKKLYVEYKLPIYKIAMLYGFSDTSLREKMISYGIEMKKHCVGRNSNNDFFKKINSNYKAYFLGLLMADGSIIKNSIRIELKLEDQYILERFIKEAKLNESIKLDNRDNSCRVVLNINSKKMIEDLKSLSLLPRKSFNNTASISNKIPKSMIRHFIRGYFDGNGIANSHGYVGFCGSHKIINDIYEHLINELEISKNKVVYNKSNKIYYIQWGKKNDTVKIVKYLYSNSNDCYLTRKYNKITKRLTGLL